MNRKELLQRFRELNPTKHIIDGKGFNYIVTDGLVTYPKGSLKEDKILMCDHVSYKLTNRKPSYAGNYHYIGLD